MPDPIIQRSFAGGELAPALHARADTQRYLQALKACRNFIVRKEGGVANRPGTRFIDFAKTDTSGKRLMRYVASEAGRGVLIEIGQAYLRFFRDGAAVTVSGVPAWSNVTNYVPGDLVQFGGVNYYSMTANVNQQPDVSPGDWYALTGDIYEVPTPYPTSDRFQWNQSGNVITITHPNHQPRELIFESITRWILQPVTTTPDIAAPSGGAGVAGAAGARTYAYIVTAAAIDTYEESNPSSVITIAACAEPTAAAPNQLTWNAQATAVEFYVYCDPFGNGVFGFIGTAASNSFNDAGFIPDFNVTPPIPRSLFTTTNDFPTTSASFQQRRFFGNTNREPDSIFGSRIGFPSNFGIASPLQDDDAVTFRIAGNNHHPVRYLAAIKAGLVTMTDGGEWTITGAGGAKQPISPNSIDAEQETYIGVAPDVRPVIVGNAIIYARSRANGVHEIRFDQEVEGLGGRDLALWATHLLRRKTIVAMDFQQSPDSIIWFVRDDGTLLGLTYIPEQDVWGWHRHDTFSNLPGADGSAQSLIEDICVVPEGDEDVLYLLVARELEGVTRRTIERLERRDARDGFFNADSFFVDCGLSYSGAPVGAVAGLDHLDGQVVAVLADGQVVFDGDPEAANAADFTVTAGQIDLPTPASNVHVGLPIRFGEIELLDIDVQGNDIRAKRKRVNAITLLIERSSRSFQAGPDSANLRPYLPNEWDTDDAAADGPFELHLTNDFNDTGRVFIRQPDPLPLAILGVIPHVDVGGS